MASADARQREGKTMADRIDLEDRARNMLGEIGAAQSGFDLEAIKDEISDRSHEEADNCVIYTHAALQIINDYERELGPDCGSDDGVTYKADEWQNAMTAYAYWIAREILDRDAHSLLERAEEFADSLVEAISEATDDRLSPFYDDLRVSRDCPHGWASHNREDVDGSLLWLSAQVDGLCAAAIDAGPFWLSFTWDPRDLLDDDDAPAAEAPAV